jgi:hypothetical protein
MSAANTQANSSILPTQPATSEKACLARPVCAAVGARSDGDNASANVRHQPQTAKIFRSSKRE